MEPLELPRELFIARSICTTCSGKIPGTSGAHKGIVHCQEYKLAKGWVAAKLAEGWVAKLAEEWLAKLEAGWLVKLAEGWLATLAKGWVD